ncbi:hypothetical protein C8R45DRAFT_1217004, partial [Mycena sanguinolenta]
MALYIWPASRHHEELAGRFSNDLSAIQVRQTSRAHSNRLRLATISESAARASIWGLSKACRPKSHDSARHLILWDTFGISPSTQAGYGWQSQAKRGAILSQNFAAGVAGRVLRLSDAPSTRSYVATLLDLTVPSSSSPSRRCEPRYLLRRIPARRWPGRHGFVFCGQTSRASLPSSSHRPSRHTREVVSPFIYTETGTVSLPLSAYSDSLKWDFRHTRDLEVMRSRTETTVALVPNLVVRSLTLYTIWTHIHTVANVFSDTSETLKAPSSLFYRWIARSSKTRICSLALSLQILQSPRQLRNLSGLEAGVLQISSGHLQNGPCRLEPVFFKEVVDCRAEAVLLAKFAHGFDRRMDPFRPRQQQLMQEFRTLAFSSETTFDPAI